MKKQVKVLLLLALIAIMAVMTMLVSSAALDAEQGENAYQVSTGDTVNGYAATLADALANANAGDTITVLKNATEAAGVEITKAITIEGGSNTIEFTVTSGWAITLNNTEGKVTIQNVTLKTAAGSSPLKKGMIKVAANGETLLKNVTSSNVCEFFSHYSAAQITVEDSTLEATGTRLVYAQRNNAGTDGAKALSGGYLRFDNCTLKNGSADLFSFEGIGTELSFNDCTMIAGASNAVYSQKGGLQIKVTGKTSITSAARGIYPDGDGGEYNGVTYRNNVVIGSSDGGDDITIDSGNCCFQVRGTGNTLTIYNGSFTATGETYNYVVGAIKGASDITIHGGSFENKNADGHALYVSVADTSITINGGSFKAAHLLTASVDVDLTVNSDPAAPVTVETTLDAMDVTELMTTWKGAVMTFGSGVISNVDIAPYESDAFGNFDGAFNGTCAELAIIMEQAFNSYLLNLAMVEGEFNPEALVWVTPTMAETLGLEESAINLRYDTITSFETIVVSSGTVSLTFTDFPATFAPDFIIVNGGDVTVNDLTATFSGEFAVVNGGKLTLNNCKLTAADTSRLVDVRADGAALVVNGGVYENNGGQIFRIGGTEKYSADEFVDICPNTTSMRYMPSTSFSGLVTRMRPLRSFSQWKGP